MNTDQRLKRQHRHAKEREREREREREEPCLGRRKERTIVARERMYQSATGALYLVTELNLLDAAPRDREPEAEVRDYDRRRSPGLE